MRPFLYLFACFFVAACSSNTKQPTSTANADSLALRADTAAVVPARDPLQTRYTDSTGKIYDIRIINKSFLHSEGRNYYGEQLPERLDIIWQHFLGTGTTNLAGVVAWSGAGWTGQPLMVEENGVKYLIQGAYDHNLKKIRADSGELIWQHNFGDVIKGTGTLWINPNPRNLEEAVLVMQGSRASGQSLAKTVGSYRGVSYFTGRELWRLSSDKSHCYSRDVDASCLVVGDTAYLGLETGFFVVFNPDPAKADTLDGILQPQIYKKTDSLYTLRDVALHSRNIVTEGSPTKLGQRIYLASGSGWVWGYDVPTQTMDWKFYIGSDMDGSPVATRDSCILIAVEKQYIAGKGGVLKLDPQRDSAVSPVVWYYPTENRQFASWQGGIIGSVSTNESYAEGKTRAMGACVAIDGFLHVFALNEIDTSKKVLLFDGKTSVATPKTVFKYPTGPAISTPLFIGDQILALTYDSLYLFRHDAQYNFSLSARLAIRGEATPLVHEGRIYVASRDGFLYCIGNSPDKAPLIVRPQSKKKPLQ